MALGLGVVGACVTAQVDYGTSYTDDAPPTTATGDTGDTGHHGDR